MQTPFLDLCNQLTSLISYLDADLLALENFQQDLYHLNEKHLKFQNRDNLQSHRQQTKFVQQNALKLLSGFLIENKITKLSDQINKIIDLKIKAGIKQIHEFITDLIDHSSQIYSKFEIPYSAEIPQKSQKIIQEYQDCVQKLSQAEGTKVNEILKKNFYLEDHTIGFGRSSFDSLSKNMEFIEYCKVKSKDLNSCKLEEIHILDQILQQRQKTINSKSVQIGQIKSNWTTKIESQSNKYSDLFDLYQKLSNLNRYKCVYQQIIHPIINFQSVHTKNKISQSQQKLNSNSIQFKIQAQGFGSSQSAHIPSLRQKVFEYILKGKSKTSPSLLKNQAITTKEYTQVQLLGFEEDLFKITELCHKSDSEKFFQFGLIDASASENFLHQSPFQHALNYQQLPMEDENLRIMLNSKPKSYLTSLLNKFSIKIVNIDSKFFIQSFSQAKLMKLNPKWEYFCLQINEPHSKVNFSEIKLYGLVKTLASQSPNDLFERDLILTCPLSPNLEKKVLKPYFSFSNFQCKIHIKNI